jgi:glycosyltransferase involved in cell wall biosynthesis
VSLAKLSVLMPVYNEQRTIEQAVRAVRASGLPVEIICVDDGSTDGSTAVLEALAHRGEVDQLLVHTRNSGKGAAIRSALSVATGDVVIIQDADLEYDPADWPMLLAPILDGHADAVFGSRFLGGTHRVLFFRHYVGNRLLTLLSNVCTNLNLTDMECCTKAMRGEVARALVLSSDRFGIEPELTARLARAGARIFEVPVSYYGRTYAQGKKISWRDGVAAIWHILRHNLLPPVAVRPAASSTITRPFAAQERIDARE